MLHRIVHQLASCFPKTASVYRDIRDHRDLAGVPARTPFGFLFSGNRSMVEGSFEATEVELISRILPEVAVLVNVGANIGYYCCLALAAGKKVIAFEPSEPNLRCLYRNIYANGWESSIEIFPVALGASSGLIKLYGTGTGASLIEGWAGQSSLNFRIAPISTLDRIIGNTLAGQRALVLMDVEGAEFEVLGGAPHLLMQDPKPVWLVEIAVSEHQPQGQRINPRLTETFSVFWNAGYDAWTATRKPRIVTRAEVERIATTTIDSLETHNFIFVEVGSSIQQPVGAPRK